MNPLIFLLILAVIGIVIFVGFYFSNKAVIKRKLKKSEFKKIADFKNHEVAKIVGTVEFVDKPLHSPLSYRECAHYYVHIEEKVSSGKSSKWETLIEEEISSKFLIKGDEHYAFINDSKLKSYIVQDVNFSSGFWTDATENLDEYLKSKGEDSEGFLGMNRTLRYKEGILERGEKIAVLGRGEWKDPSQLDLPEKYEKVLEIRSSEEEAIYLSDDPETTMKISVKKERVEPVQRKVQKETPRAVKKEKRRGRYQK